MIIFVAGTGYVSKKAAEDLLVDFIVDRYDAADVTFVLPSYLTGDGLRNVKEAIDSVNRLTWPEDFEGTFWNVTRVKKSVMLSTTTAVEDEGCIFMVVDAESEPAMVKEMAGRKVPVFDLAKGLFPVQLPDSSPAVPEMPLDGAESHTESLTLPLGYEETGNAQNRSESRPGGSSTKTDMPGLTARQRKEVEEIVQGMIAISRPDLHPVYMKDKDDLITVTEPLKCDSLTDDSDVIDDFAEQVSGLVKYYKSKTGKMRKAGKSKSRPGEEEVWLSSEQEKTL